MNGIEVDHLQIVRDNATVSLIDSQGLPVAESIAHHILASLEVSTDMHENENVSDVDVDN